MLENGGGSDGTRPSRGNQNNHVCAKCGKRMKHSEKSILYTYAVRPVKIRSWYRENKEEITRYQNSKTYAINLCEECRRAAEELIERWLGV